MAAAEQPKIGLFEWLQNVVFCNSITEGVNGISSKADIDYGEAPKEEDSRE